MLLMLVLVCAAGVFAATATAEKGGNPGNGGGDGFVPVTLCHATGSGSNPYVTITVDNAGALNGHTHHDGDIIPAPVEGCGDGGTTTEEPPTTTEEPPTTTEEQPPTTTEEEPACTKADPCGDPPQDGDVSPPAETPTPDIPDTPTSVSGPPVVAEGPFLDPMYRAVFTNVTGVTRKFTLRYVDGGVSKTLVRRVAAGATLRTGLVHVDGRTIIRGFLGSTLVLIERSAPGGNYPAPRS